MLTRERAAYLWSKRGLQCTIPRSFAEKFECNPVLYEDGLTRNENDHVHIVWDTMDGSSCWQDAFHKIRKGKV